MDLAEEYIAIADRLCARDFPAEHGWSDVGPAGPGYFMTELGADDRPGEELTAEDFYAAEEGIVPRFDARWGEASRWGTVTLEERARRNEEIAPPWRMVSEQAVDLRSWEIPETGRWVTLSVVDQDPEALPRLLLVVSETVPPLSG
ncbi:hypothetical protein ABZ848_11490 [Streptomyces sp. NPDC047081]|uniref:hypothetical protein n=1 Tax=Streptomyces sp. NPDC047081 TaxID=3154706 RepID=UPI0033D5DCE4